MGRFEDLQRPTRLLGSGVTGKTKERKASTRPVCLRCARVTDALFRRAALTGKSRRVSYSFVSAPTHRWCPECGPVPEEMTMTFGDLLELAARAKQNRIYEAGRITEGVRFIGRIKHPRKVRIDG